MRLLGIHKTVNRHRIALDDEDVIPEPMEPLQDTSKDKQISSTPLRFRAI
jgi:hypothetical protein